MDAAAEQLVLDYLRRLEDAARGGLGAAERLAFMGRSRATVARQIGETRATEAAEVRRLLRQFGDPDRLVARERQRLDREASPGQKPAEPVPGRAAGPAPGRAAGPVPGRAAGPVPGRAAGPVPGQARGPVPGHAAGSAVGQAGGPVPGRPAGSAVGQNGAEPGQAADRNGAGSAPGGSGRSAPSAPLAAWPSGRLATAAATGRPSAAAPALHRPMTARWRPGRDQPARPARGAAPDRTTGPDPGGGAEPGSAAPGWLGGVLAVLRRHPLECLAVLLIGLGGLIDPWPLWLIGALAMLASPLWDVRDKLAAVAIPLGVALVGAVAAAGFTAHAPGLSGYVHEVRVDGWNLLRAGAVLGAAYLARRIQRGRRPRREPPWHRLPPKAR